MANQENFLKALKSYAYQLKDCAAHDAQVASMWQDLKPEQRAAVQIKDYRARIYAAGYTAGQATLSTSSTPTDLPVTPQRWRDILDTALEHGSHAWAALERTSQAHIHDVARPTWPPQCTDDVGSAPYHLAALIGYTFEVYSGIFSLYPDDDEE